MNAAHRPTARRGLTLIEILIVIAILLAIGGLVVVNLIPTKEQAYIDLQRVEFDLIDSAMKQFKLDMNRYPSEDEGLKALWDKETLDDEEQAVKWRGPYLENPVINDKWGGDLTYHYPGEIRGEAYYDLISMGPDREEDSVDDITNHDRFRDAEGEIDEDFTLPDSGDGSME